MHLLQTPTRRAALGLLGGLALARPAWAQPSWSPARPIHLTVPFPAGGGVDLVGRVLAEALAPLLGQPVVVDNRAGAAGALGIEQLNRAAADGYSLGVTSSGNITIGPLLRRTAYEPLRLTHVTQLTTSPLLLLARKNLPAADLDAFLGWARGKPQEVRFGSGGVGSSPHLALELMNVRLGVKMLHVPYRGTSPLLADLAAGHVDVGFSDVSAWPMVEQGLVRLLAVSSPAPWPRRPDAPVLDGRLGEFRVSNWYGLAAPPKLPPAVLARLEAATAQALATPKVRQAYEASGFTAAPMPHAQFQDFLARETALWNSVIDTSGIERDGY